VDSPCAPDCQEPQEIRPYTAHLPSCPLITSPSVRKLNTSSARKYPPPAVGYWTACLCSVQPFIEGCGLWTVGRVKYITSPWLWWAARADDASWATRPATPTNSLLSGLKSLFIHGGAQGAFALGILWRAAEHFLYTARGVQRGHEQRRALMQACIARP
jgi:hypothetical protein